LPLANFRDPKGRIAYSSTREPQTVMSQQTLEQVLQKAGSPVELLRNSQIGPYAFPVVRAEFTNWRDEQRAWRETCALLDQSHHMTDLYIEGPDALKVLSDLAINSFKNFKVNQAKQFVACNHDGYVIGDAILFYLDENKLSLVGRPPAENWVQYHIEQGGYDAKAERGGQSRHVGTLYMELPALRRCPHGQFLPSYELQ
jgi:vanillate/3-O-methylgallate O-demethylase